MKHRKVFCGWFKGHIFFVLLDFDGELFQAVCTSAQIYNIHNSVKQCNATTSTKDNKTKVCEIAESSIKT